jgi:hypothetical protein
MKLSHFQIPLLAVFLLACLGASLRADEELGRRASWSQPSRDDVRGQLDKWAQDRKLDDAAKAQIDALWPKADQAAPADVLDTLAAVFGAVEPQAKELVEHCLADRPSAAASKFSLLTDAAPEFVRHNLRLYYGRWLARHDLYDEALEQLDGLDPAQVADPASLLFYQSVSHHRLLNKEKCLPALDKLLENESELPRRYVTLARLMDADLRPLKADTLDEVARLMEDIRRRLNFGRAGKVVRRQEDDVVAKLDKMIEDLEEQQKKQQQQQSGQGSSSPSNPRPDSTPGGPKGPGEVNPKKIGSKADWGDLPPKERQEALQQISKELPAHFREVIEEYFRKIARDGNK